MNIVLLTSTLEGGGAARVLAHMANHWAAGGHDVTLMSFEDGSDPSFYPLDPRVRVRYLALNRHSPNLLASLVNNWRRLATIRREILAAKPVAVISFIDTANVRTILALLGTGVSVIVSERVHPAYEDIGRMWRLLRRLTYPLADCLVVQTGQIADWFRGWGLKQLTVVANPVIPVPVRGDAPRLPSPCLLAVGRLYPQKDYDLLLRAFAAARVPDWTLCIAGQGPLRQKLEKLAAELGLGSRVQLLGQVQDVGGLLQQAGAYVMSSTYEGFPNALCEALAAGLPCLSTDCPSGPSEVIRDGENGLLVPVGDEAALAEALVRLLGDAELRRRLGGRAVEVASRFALSEIMAQWERVLAGSSRAAGGGAR